MKIFSLSALLFLTSPLALAAKNFLFTADGGALTITGYTGPGGVVAIPESIGGLPVTSIGAEAFINCANLFEVSIPAPVANIGDYAFFNCPNLTSVTLLDSLITIGESAFGHCASPRSSGGGSSSSTMAGTATRRPGPQP